MNFQKRFTKKILFLLIISILSLNLSFFTVPKKASAIIGIADVSITHDPLAFFQAAGKIVWDKGDQYLWNLFKALMRNVAKKMINNITQATVTWINGGMNGKPAFQADFHKFMTGPGGVNDQIMGQFFQDAGLGFLCSPFQLQIKLALQLGYGAGLKEKIGCTLTDIEQNMKNGARNSSISLGLDVNGKTVSMGASNFKKNGGWNEWIKVTQNPQNNPVGAYLIAKEELDSRITVGGETKQLDFLSGSGALSFTKCVDIYYAADNGGEITRSKEYDQNGDRPFPSQSNVPNIATQFQNFTTKQDCKVKTPGSVITGGLNKISGSGIDQLGLSASLSDGIDAILGALLNYEMGKLQKGILDSGLANNNAYNSALDLSSSNAMNNYNADLSTLYDEQRDWNNTDWTNPSTIPQPKIPTFANSASTTPLLNYNPCTGEPILSGSGADAHGCYPSSGYSWCDLKSRCILSCLEGCTTSTITSVNTTLIRYDQTTGFPIYTPPVISGNTSYNGNDSLNQAKNNATTLVNSLKKSELAYQNDYLIAKNILTQAKAVFATSSVCNSSYNKTDCVLRSILIRSNVITNIDGANDSNRTIASILWNLPAIEKKLSASNDKIEILNKASMDISGAGTIPAIQDALIKVNSTSFDSTSLNTTIVDIRSWLSGVGKMYNTSVCPIDLTQVLKINSATSTVTSL